MDNFFSHFTTLGKMKTVERWKGRRWDDYNLQRCETNADHTWRMSLMVRYYADKLSRPFDLWKATKMTYVHDLPEIIAGDIPATDLNSKYNSATGGREKFLREEKAMINLCNDLDASVQQEVLDLRYEYEEKNTREAKVVTCIDKIESYVQILEYTNGVLYEEHKDFCLQHMDRFLGVDKKFDEDIQNLKQKLITSYTEFKK